MHGRVIRSGSQLPFRFILNMSDEVVEVSLLCSPVKFVHNKPGIVMLKQEMGFRTLFPTFA